MTEPDLHEVKVVVTLDGEELQTFVFPIGDAVLAKRGSQGVLNAVLDHLGSIQILSVGREE